LRYNIINKTKEIVANKRDREKKNGKQNNQYQIRKERVTALGAARPEYRRDVQKFFIFPLRCICSKNIANEAISQARSCAVVRKRKQK
jgi:hypothetical protein